jgi:hypothetical protein
MFKLALLIVASNTQGRIDFKSRPTPNKKGRFPVFTSLYSNNSSNRFLCFDTDSLLYILTDARTRGFHWSCVKGKREVHKEF